MKIKLLRCGICSSWYSPTAHNHHCPQCSAFRMMINGSVKYFNMQSGLEIVKSSYSYARENVLAIARELSS